MTGNALQYKARLAVGLSGGQVYEIFNYEYHFGRLGPA